MPDVGDKNTPWDDVDEFYVFWFNFRCVPSALQLDIYLQCPSAHTHTLSLAMCRL